ncbi:MAG: AAA family ATPase [Bryobacterales bacterium]|nr:AAA family ATPase [Bryobacterales bacterium]
MSSAPFLQRVVLKNYRSIESCNLELGALTLLVGPNGSGKSNFLDALRFVSDSLRTTIDHALRDRGGINEVRRRSSGHPTHFGIRLELRLRDGVPCTYAFRVGARPHGGFEVQKEECVVGGPTPATFNVERGSRQSKTTSGLTSSAVPTDRLSLVSASGEEAFRPVYDCLASMAFYNLNPDRIRDLQTPDAGDLLLRDGSNAASVLRTLAEEDPQRRKRVDLYLSQVVPGVTGVEPEIVGPKETLLFRQSVKGAKAPWRFYAANMSDGTLRAFGILLSLFQYRRDVPVSLVGIEEPEAALHPGTSGFLLDALREVSDTTQVLVTSHSPDLLDRIDLDRETLLAVYAEDGDTRIAPIDRASRTVLRQGLYTPGELLRLNQLAPDIDSVIASRQMKLFGEGLS